MMKKVAIENLQVMVEESNQKYAAKSALTALQQVVEGKADAATTLAGYGITDGMTATQVAEAISAAIAGADHLDRVTVTGVDAIDVSAAGADKHIYMVPRASGDSADGDKYDEYMIIGGALEKVGDWKVDLSDYAKTAAVTQMIETALTGYAKTTDLSGLIKLTNLSAQTTGTGNVVTGVGYDNTTGQFTATKGLTALTESDFEAYTEEEIRALFAD